MEGWSQGHKYLELPLLSPLADSSRTQEARESRRCPSGKISLQYPEEAREDRMNQRGGGRWQVKRKQPRWPPSKDTETFPKEIPDRPLGDRKAHPQEPARALALAS